MSTVQRVRWSNWRGGDAGHLTAYEAGRREPFRFGATNLMHDSRDGSLVFRPGAAKLVTVAGTSGSTCVGMGWAQEYARELWFVLRNASTGTCTVYLVDTSTSPVVVNVGSPGVIAAGTAVEGVEYAGGLTYLTFPGLGLYRLNHSASTLTLLGSDLGGHTVAVYGERLYVGGNLSGVANRVRFSDALDFGSWPALNFFDVGPGQPVRYITQQRGHLTIALVSGEWWVLNGLPNSGGVLRRVATAAMQPWEFAPAAAVLRGDDVISFVGLPHDFPMTFDGAQIDDEADRSIDFNDISQPGAGPGRFVARRMSDPSEVVFRSGGSPSMVLMNRRGAWTRHSFAFSSTLPWMASNEQSWLYLAGIDGSDFAIYRWNFGHLQPGLLASPATEPVSDHGAAQFEGSIDLPEWWHPDGADVTLRSVTVIARGWGVTRPAPTLSCQVRSLGRVDSAPALSAVIDRSAPAYEGTRAFTFGFGEQGAGRGCQVLLSGITFLSILEVIADVAVDPPRQGR